MIIDTCGFCIALLLKIWCHTENILGDWTQQQSFISVEEES